MGGAASLTFLSLPLLNGATQDCLSCIPLHGLFVVQLSLIVVFLTSCFELYCRLIVVLHVLFLHTD